MEFDKFKVGKLGSGKNCRIAVREGVILHPMGRGVGTSYSTRWGKRGVSYFTKWVRVGCSTTRGKGEGLILYKHLILKKRSGPFGPTL